MIDEHGPIAQKLDIIGRGVRQGEAAFQRLQLNIQMMERRLLVQRKAPFIRVGDERNARVLQHITRFAQVAAQRRGITFFPPDEHVLVHQLLQQTGIARRFIGGCCRWHDRAENAIVLSENASARIAKRSGVIDQLCRHDQLSRRVPSLRSAEDTAFFIFAMK